MAIDYKITALYLKGPPTNDLSKQQKLSETLGNHGFELFPTKDPNNHCWTKLDDVNGNSVMYALEEIKIEGFTCSYNASIIPNKDQVMSPETRKAAADRLRAILSELEFEVIQETTK